MKIFKHGIKSALRISETSRILARIGLVWLLGNRPPLPVLMRETFEKLGATYIKLGQFIASSPSFFPAQYVEEFQLCLDKTDPLAFRTMERILKKELSQPLNKVFAKIDPVPIASASIAQVYSAVLVTGEDVVIKIQKPGVKNTLITDLNFLFVWVKIMEFFIPHLYRASLSGIINEIQGTMMEECDFYKEADNINKFRDFLDESGNIQAVVPKVYSHASSLRVLTMERFYGVSFTDLESIRETTDNTPRDSLITALNTWFASVMACDFFHADLHAGNLMVLEDGRIGFIDFGIVGKIKQKTFEAMAGFMEGMSMGNYELVTQSMMQIGITSQKIDIRAMAYDIKQLSSDMTSIDEQIMTGSINELEITRSMLSILDVGEKYGIKFPRQFALLLKQFLYFDKYIRILSPGMNIFMDEDLVMLPQ
jgi:aarF domain-containing kinase